MFEATIQKSAAMDRDWIIPVAVIAAVQMALWWMAWRAGIALSPALLRTNGFAYLTLLIVGLGALLWAVFKVRKSENPAQDLLAILKTNAWRAISAVVGVQLFSLCTGSFTALKMGIPLLVPFWADTPLMHFERAIFGTDAWRVSHALLGPLTPAIDVIYGMWMPTMGVVYLAVLFSRPSHLKTQAILSFTLIWCLLGIFAAYAFSSAGPIYYDRIFGGSGFADLRDALGSAPMALMASEVLWTWHSERVSQLAAGISAMPSVHVAIAVWVALVIGRAFPRLSKVIWLYPALIQIGSVHLGWHYASDGIVGGLVGRLIWEASRARIWQRRSELQLSPFHSAPD